MSRERLPSRRGNVTQRVECQLSGNKILSFLVTFGFREDGSVAEVFCADFKAGSDNFALIMDACVMMSRLMQYGDKPEDIAAAMSSPPSLLGAIALAAADIHRTARS